MSWYECTLGDLITLKRGHDLPNTSRIEGDIPVVSSSGITGYHNEAKAKPPGVVTGRYGTLGEVFYIEQDYWPLNTALYIIDFKDTDPRFSAYFLKNTLKSYKSDKAAVPGVDRNVLHALKVRAPDRSTQERIVEVLSKYDDLIENNKRRIELLEESARQLYKEWFVRLRFPGHEHAKIIDGVPEGWAKVPTAQVLSSHIGGGWGQDDSIGNETEPSFVIRGTDIPSIESGNIQIGLRYHKHSSLQSRWLENGDVIFEVSGGSTTQPVARSMLVTTDLIELFPEKIICASFCKRLSFHNIQQSFYFYSKLKEDRENGSLLIYQKESASALKNFNFQAFLEKYVVLLPPEYLLNVYFDFLNPIVKQKYQLITQISKLTAGRDLLLPKLMSGEIAV
ncbi:MAG: restriction endonuclease subunit S [Nitrosomonas sp.]|uniref:restriction endonuclease subunit S n=1 Tax=Nitrosomonas sp. TaxID=42353 RepID=UPI001D1FFC7F|nr:restriction endonuclease subunit S [Nitrosomonas sp.]MBX9895686.1 restriction endonuclease subunit S [Nitrosomonas sp.]